ncbi:MAG TPA: hypothetical protein VKJ00_14340 [Thermoanaerobaculia bacterium]|nr:hypothetical protein [Thermoanaerobaculia bacterium]
MRMRPIGIFALVSLTAVLGVQAQQAPAGKPVLQKPMEMQSEEPLDIWQIDLNPSGTGFALTTPKDEGDVYVFKVWPDRAVVRLPKSRVKKMVRRTKDVNSEAIYQIDLVPSGVRYSREQPTLKNGTYLFHAYHGGTLMSLRQEDVKQVTRVSGMDAFKIHLQQYGAKANADLPMQGGGSVTVLNVPSDGQAAAHAEPGSEAAAQNLPPGNWIYQGVPGVTDAWAPPSATVAYPGDVPKMPEQPH